MTIRGRPQAVAFDVVETLFSLEAVARALAAEGAGPAPLDRFFARLLRDGFALAASHAYKPFRDVADAALAAVEPGMDVGARERVLAAFSELTAHPDAEPAMEKLGAAGVRIAALTNGSAGVTKQLLERSGLDRFVVRVLSVDDVRVWKPRPEPYIHAAEALAVSPAELALVAVHGWDVHGAKRAGLTTGWAARLEGTIAPTFERPDIVGADLVDVADGLLALEDG